MSLSEIILSAFITIVIFMAFALRSNSKNCELDTKYGADGFKVSFKTSEKSTPSNER